ncbi:MAG: hypothetical protein KF893_18450 [Caldilineaceae bacterium]|nr:hypothetical protein [Caldilineaceae bacterium]
MDAIFYRLNRHQFSEIPLSRWIQIGLLGLAGFAFIARIPAYWIIASALLLLFLLFTAALLYWRGRNYMTFTEMSKPTVAPKALKPADKLPILASGDFGVEGKHARFTWLQGYFRTFATREHALLCLAQPSRFALLGHWPEKEVGMWYIFFRDKDVASIRWGEVSHGGEKLPGLAIDHEVFIPKQGRFGRERTLHRTFYMACREEEDLRRILADLLYRKPVEPAKVAAQNGAGKLPHNSNEWRRIDG